MYSSTLLYCHLPSSGRATNRPALSTPWRTRVPGVRWRAARQSMGESGAADRKRGQRRDGLAPEACCRCRAHAAPARAQSTLEREHSPKVDSTRLYTERMCMPAILYIPPHAARATEGTARARGEGAPSWRGRRRLRRRLQPWPWPRPRGFRYTCRSPDMIVLGGC